MNKAGPPIAVIGPVPPPYGGMSVQTVQLADLLRKEGFRVSVLPVNPSFPAGLGFVQRLRFLRAAVRLVLFVGGLLLRLRNAEIVHILANSYMSFFLYAAPAVFVARLYGCKIVVNYRGGLAREFLDKFRRSAGCVLKLAHSIVVPSEFLGEVFRGHGYSPVVVPNIVELERFSGVSSGPGMSGAVRLLVVRNHEKIYNIPCAIRAFERVKKHYPGAVLVLAGEGSEGGHLRNMIAEMGLQGVIFAGRVDNSELPGVYRDAAVLLNPSNVDNMPISVLEAFASGVPVVSTNVGGVPFIVRDGVTGLLVDRDDDGEMARCILELLEDEDLYRGISERGRTEALGYSWESVRPRLFEVYERITVPQDGSGGSERRPQARMRQ